MQMLLQCSMCLIHLVICQAPGLRVTWAESVDEVSIRVPVGDDMQRASLQWEVHPSRLALSSGGTQLLAGPFPDGQVVDIDGELENR